RSTSRPPHSPRARPCVQRSNAARPAAPTTGAITRSSSRTCRSTSCGPSTTRSPVNPSRPCPPRSQTASRRSGSRENGWNGPVAGEVDEAAADVEAVRPRLFGIADRLLGSAAEAEDVVQDAWLRWQVTDRSQVQEAIAFLATLTTRL